MQFTVVASNYDSLEAVAAVLIAAFDGVAVLTNHRAVFETEQDLPSELPNTYLRAIDFSF